MQGRFAALSLKCIICCIPNSTNTPLIPLDSQWKLISYNINHIFVDEEIYMLWGLKFEKMTFQLMFFEP